MKHEIFYDNIYSGYKDAYNYSFYIDESFEDIKEFLYKQHFKVDYKELGWWLEPGAKEFVKALEEQWFYNKIDTVKLYADYNFKDYLKDKYWSDAVDKAEADGALKDYSVEPNPEDYDDIDDYIEAKKDYDSVSLDN